MSADLQNVEGIRIGNDSEINCYFKLKCEACGQLMEEACAITGVTLVKKCTNCPREGEITVKKLHPPNAFTEADMNAGNQAAVLSFEINGLMPFDFDFGSVWEVISVNNYYKHVAFVNGIWTQMEEAVQVSVTNMRFDLVRWKKYEVAWPI